MEICLVMHQSHWKATVICLYAGAIVAGCRSTGMQQADNNDRSGRLVLRISDNVTHFGSGKYRLRFILINGTDKAIALHIVPQITVAYEFGSGNGSEIDLFCSCARATYKGRHWIQSESDIKTTVLKKVELESNAQLEQCVDVELPQNWGPCEVVGSWHALGVESNAIVLDPRL